jgi:hypothetical protein
MKSPLNGKEMSKISEESSIIYKGRNVKYVHTCFLCDGTGSKFTTTELDEGNLHCIHENFNKLNRIIYVGSPYSNPDESIRIKNFEVVSLYTAKLIAAGNNVFSPISYGHTMVGFCDMPTDFDFWNNFCLAFLSKCDELIVLKITGWEKSIGLAAEIKFCIDNEIPVKYVDCEINTI